MKRAHIAGLGIGVLVLVLVAASASALITKEIMQPDKPAIEKKASASQNSRGTRREDIRWNNTNTAQALPDCDDGNVVGKILGGVGGGVAGSQIGSGNGQTAATIGGTLGGAYLGGEYIPTRNVTCR